MKHYFVAIESSYDNINGSCNGPLERVRAVDPSVHTVAVMIGEDLDHDTANSVFLSADHQASTNS